MRPVVGSVPANVSAGCSCYSRSAQAGKTPRTLTERGVQKGVNSSPVITPRAALHRIVAKGLQLSSGKMERLRERDCVSMCVSVCIYLFCVPVCLRLHRTPSLRKKQKSAGNSAVFCSDFCKLLHPHWEEPCLSAKGKIQELWGWWHRTGML